MRQDREARVPANAGTVRVAIPGPLEDARFLERPNRFLVLCRLERSGEVVAAHLADPGRLREILLPGRRSRLRPERLSERPPPRTALAQPPGGRLSPETGRTPGTAKGRDRATAWTALLVESPAGAGLVSLHTTLPNRLVRQALEAGVLHELAGWSLERAEVPLGRSRIDFLLRRAAQRLALEVKSVTLVEDGMALFPDAVTARGARHVRELSELATRPDWQAAILFVVQRADAHGVRAAAAIDPVFAAALEDARRAGVHVFARRCRVALEGVELGEALPCG